MMHRNPPGMHQTGAPTSRSCIRFAANGLYVLIQSQDGGGDDAVFHQRP